MPWSVDYILIKIMSNNENPDIVLLKATSARLSEHFDTVQIFVTRQTSDGTVNCQWGSGNWFARYGQIKQWLVKEDEAACVECRKSEDEE